MSNASSRTWERQNQRVGEDMLRPGSWQNKKITAEQVASIIQNSEKDEDTGRPILRNWDCRGATFEGRVSFSKAIFFDAIFIRTTFEERVDFTDCQFHDSSFEPGTFKGAVFRLGGDFTRAVFYDLSFFANVHFGDYSTFWNAKFRHGAFFREAHFEGLVDMDGTSFNGAVEFINGKFGAGATFRKATFGGFVNFASVKCAGDIDFAGADFAGDLALVELDQDYNERQGVDSERDGARKVVLANTTVRRNIQISGMIAGSLDMSWATFQTSQDWGNIFATKVLLDHAMFRSLVRGSITAFDISADSARFDGGVHLYVADAALDLSGASFQKPSLIAGEVHHPPSLITVEHADLRNLVIAGVILSQCRFVGAHNLDTLRIEGSPYFNVQRTRLGARRQVIAEEGIIRQALSTAADDDPEPVSDAHALAGTYRSLRKSLEDSKNEPGAADFYYGEMEMRRAVKARELTDLLGHGMMLPSYWSRIPLVDAAAALGEYCVLTLYWLISGYGLRASRAFGALALLVLYCSLLLNQFGYNGEPPSFGQWQRSLLLACQSVGSLFRAPDTQLTMAGDWTVLALRYAGPVLLGLGALALRGRVKR